MTNYQLLKLILLLPALITMASTPVYADKKKYDRFERNEHQRTRQKRPEGYRFDRRYQHDRYYPYSGLRFKQLPKRHYEIRFHNRPYYYSSGIWYLRSGVQFVVTAPPTGIVIPFLPPLYTTLWIRGVPYYYANDVYYVWKPELNGYIVTTPPQDIDEDEVQPLNEQIFVYPKHGQSEKKQADDRYECHRWSVKQTDYDPSQPPENLAQQELISKRDNYQKALKACLEGRGYSVR